MVSIINIMRRICCFNIDLNNNFDRIKTNYECNVCMSSGRPPNMLGRFIKINDSQVECNGCNTIYNVATPYEYPIIPVASCTIER